MAHGVVGAGTDVGVRHAHGERQRVVVVADRSEGDAVTAGALGPVELLIGKAEEILELHAAVEYSAADADR